jgi:peptidoglycan hydrolase-like protein with peptidoglycan-binding domain
MKWFGSTMLTIFLLSISIIAQNTNSSTTLATSKNVNSNSSTAAKRPPVFRATKDQVIQAQSLLKQKGMYTGEATGTLDDSTRAALKKYQDGEKIRATGTLNRATLEKMGIVLNERQQSIPVTPNSLQPVTANSGGKTTTRAPIFRATKDQIMQAQRMLKDRGQYSGEQTGKLDDETRDALKKYQAAEKLKVTGTLNRETIEKMGIVLTDNQKAMPAASKPN